MSEKGEATFGTYDAAVWRDVSPRRLVLRQRVRRSRGKGYSLKIEAGEMPGVWPGRPILVRGDVWLTRKKARELGEFLMSLGEPR